MNKMSLLKEVMQPSKNNQTTKQTTKQTNKNARLLLPTMTQDTKTNFVKFHFLV